MENQDLLHRIWKLQLINAEKDRRIQELEAEVNRLGDAILMYAVEIGICFEEE